MNTPLFMKRIETCEGSIVNTIVHTSVHTTLTCPSLYLLTLHRRVAELTEISGQPGIVKIGPGAATCTAAGGVRSPKGHFDAFAAK